ncbi:MAG: DUF3298 and DUF4163 domain-containing protein [Oscillospiraceae bacterium]|nr:DUF3298 and DUF4163 domain-containing protein [Oscillospiraceae bacterium]
MNSIIKNILIILCPVLILSSCAIPGNIGSDKIKIEYIQSDLSNDRLDINVQIPVFKNIENKEFENRLNEYFFNDIQNNANEFTKIAGEFSSDIPEGKKASLKITCTDRYNENNFLSMITTIETYTGGVHGTVIDVSSNIDTAENKIITLSDLFNDNCDYKKVLTKMLHTLAAENTALYGELWEKPTVTDDTDRSFYIKDECLVIYFQPYELASYGRGFVDFSIPLSSLKPYLKEEYYRLFED